nr:DEAD-box ATP-dependent RNA helicase 28 [Tanacetum cinerariifolium]
MESGFSFEPPSDEEIDYEDINSDVEVDEETSDVEKDKELQTKTQSPWDFSSYTESVADEHARRSTTSIDEKISKFVQQRKPVDVVHEKDDDDEDDDDDSEPDRQEDFQPEEDDEVPTTAGGRDNKSFFSKADGVSFNANSFMDLHLSRPLLRACEALGYTKPTPIQAACIPLALTGRDICGSAITGSGKTAAFALPTLERLLFRPKHRPAIRVLILTPTRELAVQIHSMIGKLAQFITDIRSCLVLGGLSMKAQEASLRSLPDIVVATPGRMIDHLRNSMSVDLDDLAVLILDEADRLLELGFDAEIRELVRLCPKRRQTMLFSATMTEQVDELIKLLLDKPLRLSADPTTKRPSTLTEEVVRIRRMREGNHEAVLLALCSKTFTSKVIIFSGTKQAAHRLKILFGLAGFKAAELHGNLTQAQRLDALELFRRQEADFLIATNVAARGLDIIGVQTVINYECPRDLTSYVHRVGRTARAGREGYAVTFVTDNDRSLLKAIVKRAGSKLKSRIVAEQSITKWSRQIEQMEDQVASLLREEREEMALRKAEMEADKAENMITHRDEIFSRPKRTWFVTEKEKKLVANAGKANKEHIIFLKGKKMPPSCDMIEVLITVCHGGDFSKHNLFRMLLLEMLTEDFPHGTKQAAHRLKILFGLAGFKAAELHGNLTQAQRLDALELFRRQEADFLIATNVAARGLDIIGVQTVINYDYVHRVGRTARAGREGYAVTFVTDNDRSLLKAIVKRAGSKLKSRIVAEQSITKWSRQIEQMEDQVASLLREEREEMALRKAEMEADKAENMITHRDEIFSRPKRTWFVTEKEKKLVANAGKESEKGSRKKVISAEEAEERKKKEKKKREHERNLPRKKRRKLEASREMLEDEAEAGGNAKNNKEKSGISLVDLAYRRAKAAKGAKKAADAGKAVRKEKKGGAKRSSHASKSRPEEMKELFQGDMSEKKQKRTSCAGGKKSSSFKSKSRYKRR